MACSTLTSSIVVILLTIICYGVPVFGLCTPDQVDFNSVCYQVFNMSGAVATVEDVEIFDFAFFRYEVNQLRQNPAFVSFETDHPDDSILRLTALQLCNEGGPSAVCSWDGLNFGNVTLTSDKDAVFNPTLLKVTTTTSCGCDLYSSNGTYLNPVWYIRIQNLNATTQNSTLNFTVTSVDVCSGRGNFSNGRNVSVPPITSPGSYCLCDAGFAGSQCQFDVANISIGSVIQVNTSSQGMAYLRFQNNNTGFNDLTFRATTNSSNCASIKHRIAYSCGKCNPAYPFAFDANFTETFTPTGRNYSQFHTFSPGSAFTVSIFHEIRDKCGCNINNTMEEWYWAIDASQTNVSCSFYLSVNSTPACGDPSAAVCGGVGTCTSHLCDCPHGRQGLQCTSKISDPKELYNGVFYAKLIKPRVNVVTQTYVTLSPLTNKNINIILKPFSGDVNGYLGAVESQTNPNPTVATNGTLDQNGTMIFLAKFSEPPRYELELNPVYFPSLAVTLNKSATHYDYAATLNSDSGASVVIPIDKNTPEKLYITVLSLGTYSAVDGKPLEEPDIEFVMYVDLEDNIATFIDVVLMIVFIVIVLFFCVAWKTCPSIFHSTMKKIIPELYFIEYKKKEQEQIERAKISTEVAKTAAYALAGTIYGLLQVLTLIPFPQDPNQVLDEDFPKNPSLEAAFNFMDNWMKNLSMPVVKLDVVPYNIPPRLLLQQIKGKIPLQELSAALEIPEEISPAEFLSKISAGIPSDLANAEISIPFTNLPDLIAALSVKFPDVTVIKEIGIELTAISSANLPLIPMPEKMDARSILNGFKSSLSQLPNMAKDVPLFLKIDKLSSLPDIQSVTLEELGVNVNPVSVLLNMNSVQFPTVNILKFKHDISLNIDIEVDVPKFRGLDLVLRFILGVFTISLQNFAFVVIEFLILMFNVAMIHSAFFEYPSIQPGMPKIEQVQEAFSNISGDLGNFVYVMSGFFKYLDFFFLLNSWNCGGTLTMITPFVFLLGAVLTWIILEKDLLLYIAIKLKVHKADPKSKISMAASSVWMGMSRVMVKVTILTLQAVILCLAQAVTKTTTNRTCNDVDLVANTFGKVIVAFFYIFFYVMFFFIFTGAPDWV